jgi:hypothetical protein
MCLATVRGAKYCSDCKGVAISGGPAMASQGPIGECEEAASALKYAIIGIFCFGIILEPIAIAKGFKAKKLIAENPRLTGEGKATAAIIIGFIFLGIWILAVIAQVAMAGHR